MKCATIPKLTRRISRWMTRRWWNPSRCVRASCWNLDSQNRVVGIEILNVRHTLPQADLNRLELELA